MSYNTEMQENNAELEEILAAVNELPDAGATGDYIPVPATAEVGQTIRVSAVDENGKPTAWEAVDMASGGGETKTLVATYVHGGNLEVVVSSIDYTTSVLTAPAHGLSENDNIYATLNLNCDIAQSPEHLMPSGLSYGTLYYAINVTADTFQLSTSSGGTAIALTARDTSNFAAWHFERDNDKYGSTIVITGLGGLRDFAVNINGSVLINRAVYANMSEDIDYYSPSYFDGWNDVGLIVGTYAEGQVGNILISIEQTIKYDAETRRYKSRRTGLVSQTNGNTYSVATKTMDTYFESVPCDPVSVDVLTFWNCAPANGIKVEVYRL